MHTHSTTLACSREEHCCNRYPEDMESRHSVSYASFSLPRRQYNGPGQQWLQLITLAPELMVCVGLRRMMTQRRMRWCVWAASQMLITSSCRVFNISNKDYQFSEKRVLTAFNMSISSACSIPDTFSSILKCIVNVHMGCNIVISQLLMSVRTERPGGYHNIYSPQYNYYSNQQLMNQSCLHQMFLCTSHVLGSL